MRETRRWMRFAAVGLLLSAGLQTATQTPVVARPVSCPDVAASAESARSTASACGKRVEVLAARTESSQTFAAPAGGFVFIETAGPTRVHRPDGSWVAADATLVRRADGTVAPVATGTDLTLSGGGTGAFVRATRAGRSLSMSWRGTLPAPTLSGDTATYVDVLPGVDLQVIARIDGFSENVVVKTALAAHNPAVRRLVFSTATTGVTLRAATDGSGALVAVDDRNRPVFQAAPPRMWSPVTPATGRATAAPFTADAPAGEPAPTGEAVQRKVALSVGAGALTLTPDAAMLDGAAFPVTIDPTWITWTGSSGTGLEWAQVYKTYPTTNYLHDTDAQGLRVGHAQADASDNYTPYTNRAFWTFGTPAVLDGATVNSATFSAEERYAWTCAAMHVDLWESSGISSSTTWNNQPAFNRLLDNSVTTAHGYNSSCTGPVRVYWTATAGAADDAASHWHSLTLALRTPDESVESPSNWHKYIASTATLTIAYDNPPATPAADALSINRAGQVSPCASGPAAPHVNTTAGVTLQATLTDPDGGSVTAHWTLNGTVLADDAPQPSGSTQTRLVPGSALPTDGATYSFSVVADDGTFTSGASPTCQFVADNNGLDPPSATAAQLNLALEPALPGAAPATAVVGVPAAVTLQPAPTDTAVVGYRYWVSTSTSAAPISYIPAAVDGSAVLSVVPLASGLSRNYLIFSSLDAAGNVSPAVRYSFKALAGTTTHVAADATGDGRADVTVMSDVGGGNSMLWRWNMTAAGAAAPTLVQDATAVYPNAATLSTTGDFDGDGLSDVGVFTQSGANVVLTVQRSNRDHLLGTPTVVTISGWSIANMKIATADFTGDGLADIEVRYNMGAQATNDWMLVSTSTPGAVAFAAPALWAVNCSGCDDWNRAKIVAGDFNNDGKADLAEFYDFGNGQTKIWLLNANATGTAFVFAGMPWDSGLHFWTWSSSKFFVGDFNGDGRMDIGASYADPYAYATSFWIFPQTASGTIGAPAAWTGYAFSWNLDFNSTEPVPGDFDADGKTDLALVVHCCGTDQTTLWTMRSNGTSFDAPVYRTAGALGLATVGSVSPVLGARYNLVAAHSGKCLEIAGGSTGSAAPADQSTCVAGALHQQFTVVPVSGGYVTLQPAQVTGMCLDVAGINPANNVVLDQYACVSHAGSQMYLLNYVSGTGAGVLVQIKPLFSMRCLTVNGALTTDGAAILQYDCLGGLNQEFYLQRAS